MPDKLTLTLTTDKEREREWWVNLIGNLITGKPAWHWLLGLFCEVIHSPKREKEREIEKGVWFRIHSLVKWEMVYIINVLRIARDVTQHCVQSLLYKKTPYTFIIGGWLHLECSKTWIPKSKDISRTQSTFHVRKVLDIFIYFNDCTALSELITFDRVRQLYQTLLIWGHES